MAPLIKPQHIGHFTLQLLWFIPWWERWFIPKSLKFLLPSTSSRPQPNPFIYTWWCTLMNVTIYHITVPVPHRVVHHRAYLSPPRPIRLHYTAAGWSMPSSVQRLSIPPGTRQFQLVAPVTIIHQQHAAQELDALNERRRVLSRLSYCCHPSIHGEWKEIRLNGPRRHRSSKHDRDQRGGI